MSTVLERIAAKLQEHYGSDVIFDPDNPPKLPVLSTGSFLLDYATGVGGLPGGRVTELYGNPSSGKSTVAFHVVKEAQTHGMAALYLDYEHAVDFAYAQSIGVSFARDRFLWVKPKSLEQGLDIAKALLDKKRVGVVIVDSMAAMTTEKEFEDQIGHTAIGMQARAVAQAMKVITPLVGASGCVWIFINQIRDKIAISGPMAGKKSTTTPGGVAPKFAASLRIEFRTRETLKGKVPNLLTGQMEDGLVATKVEARVTKNKVATPHGKAWFFIRYGRGIDHEMSLIDIALARQVIKRGGGGYYEFPPMNDYQFDGQAKDEPFKCRGLETALKFLRETPQYSVLLEREVKNKIEELLRIIPQEGTLDESSSEDDSQDEEE